MAGRWWLATWMVLLLAGCAKKQAQTPPAAPPPKPAAPAPKPAPPAQKQSMFVLLEDPSGKSTSIVVTNARGTQEISQPDQAVRVANANAPPTAPFAIDPPTVRRLFGGALDAMPEAEARFVLYFDEARDVPNAAAEAMIPAILNAIADRRSTDIRVTGHTDTTGTSDENLKLGQRRAEAVAAELRAQGVAAESLYVTSYGEADQVMKTARGKAEPLNRRVEVIVH